jgi:hypothetical protein
MRPTKTGWLGLLDAAELMEATREDKAGIDVIAIPRVFRPFIRSTRILTSKSRSPSRQNLMMLNVSVRLSNVPRDFSDNSRHL